jgi:hypothetical protein
MRQFDVCLRLLMIWLRRWSLNRWEYGLCEKSEGWIKRNDGREGD